MSQAALIAFQQSRSNKIEVETGRTRHVLGDNHGCRRPVQTTDEKVGSRVVGLHIESEGSSNTVSKATTPRHY